MPRAPILNVGTRSPPISRRVFGSLHGWILFTAAAITITLVAFMFTASLALEEVERVEEINEQLAEVNAAWRIAYAMNKMVGAHFISSERTDRYVRTAEGWLDFQEYFVGRRHAEDVLDVRFDGIEQAQPAGPVIPTLFDADVILICPSNPIVSVDPILNLDGVRHAVAASLAKVVSAQFAYNVAERFELYYRCVE